MSPDSVARTHAPPVGSSAQVRRPRPAPPGDGDPAPPTPAPISTTPRLQLACKRKLLAEAGGEGSRGSGGGKASAPAGRQVSLSSAPESRVPLAALRCADASGVVTDLPRVQPPQGVPTARRGAGLSALFPVSKTLLSSAGIVLYLASPPPSFAGDGTSLPCMDRRSWPCAQPHPAPPSPDHQGPWRGLQAQAPLAFPEVRREPTKVPITDCQSFFGFKLIDLFFPTQSSRL